MCAFARVLCAIDSSISAAVAVQHLPCRSGHVCVYVCVGQAYKIRSATGGGCGDGVGDGVSNGVAEIYQCKRLNVCGPKSIARV